MRKLIGLIVAAILLVGAVDPTKTLSIAEFRDRYATAARAVSQASVEIIDERTFKVNGGAVTNLTVNVDNAYAKYLSDPAQLDAIVERYAHAIVAANSLPTEPIDTLVAIVRPSDYIVRSLPAESSSKSFVSPRPFAGDLSLFLAVDSPETIRTASKEDLDRWKIDESKAWAIAARNLKNRLGPLQMTRLGSEDGASGLGADSGLAPSVLTDPKFCGPDNPIGIQGQVVLVYSKDVFLFAVPMDAAMTKLFWKVVKAEIEADRTLSRTPLTCRKGRWVAVPIP